MALGPAGAAMDVAGRGPPDAEAPALTSLLSTQGHRPPWIAILAAAVVTGGIAGAITAPLAAPVAAAAVVVGCLAPWSRLLYVLAPVGLLAATGVYVVEQQISHHYASNIDWPAAFPVANTLTWMAVVALLVGAVVEVARWRPWAGEEVGGVRRRTDEVSNALSQPAPAIASAVVAEVATAPTEAAPAAGTPPADSAPEGHPSGPSSSTEPDIAVSPPASATPESERDGATTPTGPEADRTSEVASDEGASAHAAPDPEGAASNGPERPLGPGQPSGAEISESTAAEPSPPPTMRRRRAWRRHPDV
jgi:hypothetical protein